MKTKRKTQSQLGEDICLNDQTTENLIKYLQRFPKGAKVEIWHDYKTYDCQICCNFEHQQDTKTAMVMTGTIINPEA